jgi:hypothetical protein
LISLIDRDTLPRFKADPIFERYLHQEPLLFAAERDAARIVTPKVAAAFAHRSSHTPASHAAASASAGGTPQQVNVRPGSARTGGGSRSPHAADSGDDDSGDEKKGKNSPHNRSSRYAMVPPSQSQLSPSNRLLGHQSGDITGSQPPPASSNLAVIGMTSSGTPQNRTSLARTASGVAGSVGVGGSGGHGTPRTLGLGGLAGASTSSPVHSTAISPPVVTGSLLAPSRSVTEQV